MIGKPLEKSYIKLIRGCFYSMEILCQQVADDTSFSANYVRRVLTGGRNVNRNNEIILVTAKRYIAKRARIAEKASR